MKTTPVITYAQKLCLSTVITLIIGALFKVKIYDFWLLPQYLGVLKMLIGFKVNLVQNLDPYLSHQTADVDTADEKRGQCLSVSRGFGRLPSDHYRLHSNFSCQCLAS